MRGMGLEGPTHLCLLFSWVLGLEGHVRRGRMRCLQPLWPSSAAHTQDPTAGELMSTDRVAFHPGASPTFLSCAQDSCSEGECGLNPDPVMGNNNVVREAGSLVKTCRKQMPLKTLPSKPVHNLAL